MTNPDFLPALEQRPPEALLTIRGDLHPNALAHHLMADALLPVIRLPSDAATR